MQISFFCRLSDRKSLDIVEFYAQDINALKQIDPDAKIAINYNEINWKADTIFIWWWTFALYPVLRARLTGKKVIITGTFNYRCPDSPVDYFRRPWYQRLLIRSAMRMATLNILVSKNEFEQIQADWKYKNIVYSPHGVDTNKYLPSVAKKKYMIFTMCWTGKLNMRRKCLPEIIEAMAIINSVLPGVTLFIGGRTGDGHDEVQEMVKSNGVLENVVLLGEVTEAEKIRYYQECAIYLQPSRYEGFGLAIAEAMSCGATVVSTDAGEVRNLVGDCGIIIKSVDPKAIADAVLKILENKESLSDQGRRASRRINDFFPLERREKDIIHYVTT